MNNHIIHTSAHCVQPCIASCSQFIHAQSHTFFICWFTLFSTSPVIRHKTWISNLLLLLYPLMAEVLRRNHVPVVQLRQHPEHSLKYTVCQQLSSHKILAHVVVLVRVSHKDKTLQSNLLFKFINAKLSLNRDVHVFWVTANLQLNKAARTLNTVSDKGNLHVRDSLNLQTTN